jgi:hypothetical protein
LIASIKREKWKAEIAKKKAMTTKMTQLMTKTMLMKSVVLMMMLKTCFDEVVVVVEAVLPMLNLELNFSFLDLWSKSMHP